jgi:hypothetical protein
MKKKRALKKKELPRLEDVRCYRCKNHINIHKEKYIHIMTKNGNSMIDESYFHFMCWGEFFLGKNDLFKGIMESAGNIIQSSIARY